MKVAILSLFVLAMVAVVYSVDPDILNTGDLPSDFPTDLPRRRCGQGQGQGQGQGFFRRFFNGDRGVYGGRRVPTDLGGTGDVGGIGGVGDTSRYFNRRYNGYNGRRGNGYGRFGGPNNDIPDRGDVEFV